MKKTIRMKLKNWWNGVGKPSPAAVLVYEDQYKGDIRAALNRNPDNLVWSKVHGTPFTVYTGDKGMSMASRKQLPFYDIGVNSIRLNDRDIKERVSNEFIKDMYEDLIHFSKYNAFRSK